MRIKKNGKVINLTESDLKRIVKRTLKEQEEPEIDRDFDPRANGTLSRKDDAFIRFLNKLGGFKQTKEMEGVFIGPDGKPYVIGLNWTYNEVGVPDDPKWVDEEGEAGGFQMGRDFYDFFKSRNKNIQ